MTADLYQLAAGAQRSWADEAPVLLDEPDLQLAAAAIDELHWRPARADQHLPYVDARAVHAIIRELDLADVALVAYDGTLTTAGGTFALYGIEARNAGGVTRTYLLDDGIRAAVICTDHWPA